MMCVKRLLSYSFIPSLRSPSLVPYYLMSRMSIGKGAGYAWELASDRERVSRKFSNDFRDIRYNSKQF